MKKANDHGTHALIIEENAILSRAIEQQLRVAGFRSIDHAHMSRRGA